MLLVIVLMWYNKIYNYLNTLFTFYSYNIHHWHPRLHVQVPEIETCLTILCSQEVKLFYDVHLNIAIKMGSYFTFIYMHCCVCFKVNIRMAVYFFLIKRTVYSCQRKTHVQIPSCNQPILTKFTAQRQRDPLGFRIHDCRQNSSIVLILSESPHCKLPLPNIDKPWTAMKCHELPWTAMNCHELPWTAMNCHELLSTVWYQCTAK